MDRRTQQALIQRLRADAQQIAHHFGLRYRAIHPERANVKRRYGVCFSDGEIRIRLRHVRTGEALKYSSLVNTLCHELAHLRHFHHGDSFKQYYLELLAWARAQGIYQPDPPGAQASRAGGGERRSAASKPRRRTSSKPPAQGPEQLGLFG